MKKAMLLTFDSGLALFLVIAIIVISSFYITKGDRQTWTQIQMERLIQDAIAAMDNNKTLQTLDLTLIGNSTVTLLGSSYNFSFVINEYNASYNFTRNLTIRTLTKKKTTVMTGSYLFLRFNQTLISNYYWLKYWVWQV